MYLVSDNAKPVAKPANTKVDIRPVDTKPAIDADCVETAISLISNIVETACERAPDLDLMRLVNFMDLYRVYLELAKDSESDLHAYIKEISAPSDAVLTQNLGTTELVSFERFVRDSRLISMAASAVGRDTGEKISPPPPLTVSAND